MNHDEIQKLIDEIMLEHNHNHNLAAILQANIKCENNLPIVAITHLDGSMPDRLEVLDISDKIANLAPVSCVVLRTSNGQSKVELLKETESLTAQLNDLKSKLEFCRKKVREYSNTISSYQGAISRRARYEDDYLPYHEEERGREGD